MHKHVTIPTVISTGMNIAYTYDCHKYGIASHRCDLGVDSQIIDSYPDKNTNANDNDNNSYSRRGKGKTWGLCNCGEVTPLVNIFYF